MAPSRIKAANGLITAPAAGAALLGAIFLAWRGIWLLSSADPQREGWLWLLAAALLAAYAFVVHQRLAPEDLLPPRFAVELSSRRRVTGALLIFLGSALAGIALFNLSLLDNHQEMRWLWLASLAALIAGSFNLGALGPPQVEPASPVKRERRLLLWEAAGFLALLALTIWLRVYRIDQIPPGAFVDETNAAVDALYIMEGRPDSPFATGWFETPNMYAFYLVGLFNLLGTTLIALKTASLLPAILTVAAIYPLARLLFGIPTALAVFFLLAVNRWHMTMSRWGWNEVAPLLFMIGALFFLLRAIRDRRAIDYALAGLLLGLGHYTYLASRLVVLVVVLYVLYRLVFERGFWRRTWQGLLLFLLLYLVAFSPLLLTYISDPFTFGNRTRQVSILQDMALAYDAQAPELPPWLGDGLAAVGLARELSLQPLIASVQRHLEMFHVAGDGNPRHNLPGAPMLDPVTGVLLILALGFALLQAMGLGGSTIGAPGGGGGHRFALLLLWLAVPLLGGILTRLEEAPQAYRTLPVVGAVALLAGDAAVRSARLFTTALAELRDERSPRWLQMAPPAAAVALLALAGRWNYEMFFVQQAQNERVRQAFSPVENAVAATVAGKVDDTRLYLSPRVYYFSPVRYFAYRPPDQGGGIDRPLFQVADPGADLPLSDLAGQNALFLLDDYYGAVPQIFTAFYPNARFDSLRGQDGQPLFQSVAIDGADIAALQGLVGAYQTAMDSPVATAPYLDAPSFAWPASQAANPGAGAAARWSGSLKIPQSGVYDLRLVGPGELRVNEQPWPGPQFLGKGLHALAIRQEPAAPDMLSTLHWRRHDGTVEPVPAQFFFRSAPPTHGLLGRYYQGEAWAGEPVFTRVDPVLLFAWPEAEPWPAPFSVRWTGSLLAPRSGVYLLKLAADDGVRLWIDDVMAGEATTPDAANLLEAQVELAAGAHRIQIDFFQRGGGKALEFWWQPPNGQWQPVPPEVLQPEAERRR